MRLSCESQTVDRKETKVVLVVLTDPAVRNLAKGSKDCSCTGHEMPAFDCEVSLQLCTAAVHLPSLEPSWLDRTAIGTNQKVVDVGQGVYVCMLPIVGR